ncbi:hypothetical protein J19TS2_17440 [Cohnella xylanilytica]|nr:hypothetical protein J19TS2_17440 [Cohnella xylanilytica]
MAERTSSKKPTASELIVQKLKETFDRKGTSLDEGSNVWVMAAAAKTKVPLEVPHRSVKSCWIVLKPLE